MLQYLEMGKGKHTKSITFRNLLENVKFRLSQIYFYFSIQWIQENYWIQ